MIDFLYVCALIVMALPMISLVVIIPILLWRALKFFLMLRGFVSPEDC
jgi:hypothetical protein